jgi:hypothetical protein
MEIGLGIAGGVQGFCPPMTCGSSEKRDELCQAMWLVRMG